VKKTAKPILGQIMQKIAPTIGATVIMEPRWEIVGQIVFKNRRIRYFKYSSLDINPLGASEVARDKDYANFFLKKKGYPTVPGSKTFFSGDWAKAIGVRNRDIDASYRYAKKLGFPVFVKPNSGSQGTCVSLVHTKKDFYKAMRAIFKRDKVVLVQQRLHGQDYRIVVLDGEVISAYERLPLNVLGNGRSTISQLIAEKKKQFTILGRETKIKKDDPRITEKLKRRVLSLGSIPDRGERIYLLDNANLSTGGEALDTTTHIHPEFRRIAVSISKDMGLRLCGIDIMSANDITQEPSKYWVLEVNASPGLDNYAKSGRTQKKIVEDLYLRILKSMETK